MQNKNAIIPFFSNIFLIFVIVKNNFQKKLNYIDFFKYINNVIC